VVARIADGMTDLEASIEQLYAVFSGYPVSRSGPCPHCYGDAEFERVENRIQSVPLRDLTLDDLYRFYSDGLLTWGDVDDFRYLLPRLMELFAAYHLGYRFEWHGDDISLQIEMSPDLALMRFVDAEWWSWPQNERDVINVYLNALFDTHLNTTMSELPDGHWIEEDVPEAILRLAPDTTPFLDRWRSRSDWAAIRHLAWFVANDHLNSWLIWEDPQRPTTMANWNSVKAWLADTQTRVQLEKAARSAAPRDMAWEAVLAMEVLDRGRKAVEFSWGSWIPDETSGRRAEELGVKLPNKRKRARGWLPPRES